MVKITLTTKHDGKYLGERLIEANKEGLEQLGKSVLKNAVKHLSGEGSKYINIVGKYRRRKKEEIVPPGSYPVPVRTGNLRRLTNYASPGSTAKVKDKSYKVEDNEVLIFNGAGYAKSVHNGIGRNSKHGPRTYMTDGFKDTNVIREFDKGFSRVIHD